MATLVMFQQLISQALQSNCLRTALFHAEQYHNSLHSGPSEHSAYLLGLVCLRMQHYQYMTSFLQPYASSSLRCCNLLAEAYFHLDMLKDALYFAESGCSMDNWDENAQQQLQDHKQKYGTWDCAKRLLLMGYIYKSMHSRSRAVDCFQKCLLTCPLMFEAAEQLGILGNPIELDRNSIIQEYHFFDTSSATVVTGTVGDAAISEKKTKIMSGSSPSVLVRKSASSRSASATLESSTETLRVLRERKRNRCGEFLAAEAKSASGMMDIDYGKLTKPSTTPTTMQSTVDYDLSAKGELEYEQLAKTASDYNQLVEIMTFTHIYQFPDALKLIDTLSQSIATLEMSMVRCWKARCLMESQQYKKACEDYRWIHQHGIVTESAHYSTVLWHLKDATSLATLGKQVMKSHRQSPYSWCILGNCFSLQKRHEDALLCFERATTIDESYAYAYNLAGHEYMATEAYDNALTAFRKAIHYDNRLYNAWYGLGLVYYRQEKWVHAQSHFERALEINPKSSILHCFMGMALNKLRRNEDAISVFTKGIELDERNPQIRYRKAMTLVDMGEYRDALKQLQVVADLAPTELNVYFRMGQIYAKLGDNPTALNMYFTAMDGKNSAIKDAIEQLNY